MLRSLLCLLLLAAAPLSAIPASAAESPAVATRRTTATLVSDTDAVRPGTPLRLALRLRIAPGWHTYWQNPGDAGVPPELTLALPPGATATPIAWPTPLRLPEGPVMTYGYTREVLLPVTVTPGADPLVAEADATWLVCETVCVPEEAHLRLALPAGAPSPSAEAPLFAAAPRPSPFAARIAPGGTLTLSGAGLSPDSVTDAWFFPTAPDQVDQPTGPTRVADGTVRIPLHPGRQFNGAALDGVVVLQDPRGQQSSLAVSAVPGAEPAATAPLWQTLLLALAGGLVLNAMPCVFPVLAMKAIGLARLSGGDRGAVRAHAGLYTAGVVVAFVALGLGLVGLRAVGVAAGWGFQFQSPVFVAVLAWLLFALGLNLSGVFSVGSGLAGAGQGFATRGGHAGSFFTGLLAVVVATPCTAPFMGAAVAAGLAAPPAITAGIFAAMGLGLAAPYAALALLPGLVRLLPRPGPWMDVLRGALAFPMYAAAAWLVWVGSVQSGSAGTPVILAGLVLLGFAAWAWNLAARPARWIAVAAVLGAVALLPTLAGPAPALAAAADSEAFTPARLSALRAEGHPVFVNMTAAWCVTCLVNERLALSPAAVQAAFAAHRVAYLKGDWTGGDPAITAFLRAHDRDGVPLYVLYPAKGDPAVLPQILTESDMLAHLAAL